MSTIVFIIRWVPEDHLMATRYTRNDYPPRHRRQRLGKPDRLQRKLSSDHRAVVRKILESNPGLNVSQIAEIAALDRKTIRKHLGEMQAKSSVEKVGAGYFLASGASDELNSLVKKAFREGLVNAHNVLFARNTAGCYSIVDPGESRFRFLDWFESKVIRFKDDDLWLDEILTYAIRYGFVSRRVHSKKEKRIDRKLLRKGWEQCFGDTRLLVFAYAISPQDFLRFLLSPRGVSWATRVLERKWDSIMKEVTERPAPKTARPALQWIKNE